MYKKSSYENLFFNSTLFGDKEDKENEAMFMTSIDYCFLPEIDQITDKIYLGNYDAARMKEMLKMRNITHIMAVGKSLEALYPDEFAYLVVPVMDRKNENIAFYFKQCFEFIDNAEKIYIHCQAGVSRSATVVIAYLMWKMKMKYRDAHKYVLTKRRIISPNEGFVKQLKKFENEVFENKKYFN